MPSRSSIGKRKATRSPARAFRRRRSSSGKRVLRKKSGNLGNIHTFKGIVNAGILAAQLAATSTHLGGQYIFKLSDLPIVGSAGAGIGNCFDFVRLNRCKMEFMPRFNVQSANNGTGITGTSAPQTFLTGVDEIPILRSGVLTVAPTWLSQGDEDANITETSAYDHPDITPDYLRGMPNVKETEVYRKHTVHFIPTFFDYAVNNVAAGSTETSITSGVYKACRKQWVNCNFLQQNTGAETAGPGPDFYGPMYSFGNNVGSGGQATQYYDVKLHYSVSFRRLRGL